MPTRAKEPIVVSRSAYKDLLILKKAIDESGSDFVAFPEVGDSKFASINELYRAKHVIEKKGARPGLYGLKVPLELVQESERKTKVLNKSQGPKTEAKVPALKNPVSRGGYLPDFYTLKAFVLKTEEESKLIGTAKSEELEKRIEEMAVSLAKTKNASERSLLIQELAKADEQRKNLGASIIIEAIKNTAAAKEFKQYDFDASIVSIDPADYLNN